LAAFSLALLYVLSLKFKTTLHRCVVHNNKITSCRRHIACCHATDSCISVVTARCASNSQLVSLTIQRTAFRATCSNELFAVNASFGYYSALLEAWLVVSQSTNINPITAMTIVRHWIVGSTAVFTPGTPMTCPAGMPSHPRPTSLDHAKKTRR